MYIHSERLVGRLGCVALALTMSLSSGCGRDRIPTSSSSSDPTGPVFIKELVLRRDRSASSNGDDRRVTQWIDGARGGTVVNGRFSVTFAPGAFANSLEIILIDATDEFLECHLFPEGILFEAPVALSVDLEETTGDDAATTVYWNDRDEWVDVGSWYVSGEHTVSTDLDHFSEYRPGRAGW